ncbi:MAG: hypothetical protein CV087_24225 [Candidatus Brocadia sp. WS118]|nr:MAG: hypothetical protein CV087_24225 [Candidatus Brocadia sp. WS118]
MERLLILSAILLLSLSLFAQNPGNPDTTAPKAGTIDEISAAVGEKMLIQERDQEIAPPQDTAKQQSKNEQYRRWSFGVAYVPYYSGKIYQYAYELYYSVRPYFYTYSDQITMLEGQFGFGVSSKVRLTLDVGYTKTYNSARSEEHIRYTDLNINYDSGLLATSDLKIFDFTFGVKYYLKRLLNRKASACVLAGVGKQLAFASGEIELLFLQEPPAATFEDNRNEYLEDLNSPWHINVGFAAEYSFNESLSLFSSIRFYYSKISAFYDYREVSASQTRSGSLETKNSEIVTRIGLGVNFYF